VLVAANLCFEPVVGELLRREFGIRRAAAGGDTVTPLLVGAAAQEWEWARSWSVELARFLRTDEDHGAANGQLIDAWTRDWRQRCSRQRVRSHPVSTLRRWCGRTSARASAA
jgi:Methane/Phenol/Toluene Hydroxylase